MVHVMFDVNDYEKEIEMFNRPDNKMTLAEIAADALKPENQRVYPVGTRRDWQAELDAQRLRADTAVAELKREKEFHAVNVSESERKLAAAEQRIARMEVALKFYADKDHFSTDDGLNWDSCSGEPSNILWHEEQPWFIEDGSIARAALNQKSEAESQ